MIASAGVALLACAAVSVAAPAQNVQGYRLAGVIATGADRMGFLALPDGGQVMIRRGSVLPDGSRVVEFTDRVVRLALAGGGMVELALQASGSASPPVAVATPARAAAPSGTAPGTVPATMPGENPSEGIVVRERNQRTILLRTVDERAARTAIKPRIDAAKAARGKAGEPSAAEAVAVNLGPIFDLPAGSQLQLVEGHPIKSAAEVMDVVQKKLSAGQPVTMNVTDPNGRDQRVYIMPSDTRPRVSSGG